MLSSLHMAVWLSCSLPQTLEQCEIPAQNILRCVALWQGKWVWFSYLWKKLKSYIFKIFSQYYFHTHYFHTVTKKWMHILLWLAIDTSHGLDKINDRNLKLCKFQPVQASVFAQVKWSIGLNIKFSLILYHANFELFFRAQSIYSLSQRKIMYNWNWW